MKYLFGFIIILFLSSCLTTKKVERYLNDNKEFAANFCAETFPIKETTSFDTIIDTLTLKEYVDRIDKIIIHDTIEGKEKIIEAVKYKIKQQFIDRPPKTIVKTIIQENTAKIEALTKENKRIGIELINCTRQNANLRMFKLLTFVSLFLFLLFIALYFWARKNKLFS